MSKSGRSAVGRVFGHAFRVVIPLAILGAGALGYTMLARNPEEPPDDRREERKILTRVTDLEVQDYPIVVKTQGIVRAHNEITLSAQVSGQITYLSPSFDVGSYFSEGEVLVRLDTRDYENEVAIAEARLTTAQSQVEIAEAEFDSYQTLFDRNFTSESELNRYVASRAQALASLDSAKAALEQAKLELERTTIRAPFDGRVRERNVGVGQSIGSGSSLGTIFAVDYAEVRLPIAARDRAYLDLPDIGERDPVPVELQDAIHPDPNMTWDAQIVRTEGTLDEDSLELVAIARIDDPFGLESGHPTLRIGQPVTGYVPGKVLEDVVAIPRSAVRELDQIVLVSKSDLRLTRVRIDPVWSDADHIVVPYSDVFDGMVLSTTHIVYAPEGAQVEIIPPVSEAETPDAALQETGG